MLQANYCIKISPYFSKSYNFKYHKNTLYGYIYTHLLGYQKISLGRGFKVAHLGLCFSQILPKIRCWKAEKQLRDADSHSQIFLKQSNESNLKRCVDKKMENVFSFKLV